MTSSSTPPAPLGPAARTGNTAFPTSVALLLLRIALGWTFLFHGAQKIFGVWGGYGIEGFAQGLARMGLPSFLPPTAWAYLAAYGEFLGGVAVLLGLFARLGALPILVTMLIAIAKVHGPNGFSNSMDPATGKMLVGYEYNINLIAMAAVVLLAGPGLISLDALLFRRGLWARGAQPLSEPTKRA